MPTGEAPKPAPKGKGMWIGIAVVVVVVVVLLAAVLGGFFVAPPGEDGVLKIGAVLSITGRSGLEIFGPRNLRGAQLAVEEINDDGGVLGRPVQLILEDDQGIDAVAADKARKLITADRVDVILGAVGSGKCAAALEVTRPNQVVQISASCTSPVFSNTTYSGGWFFRTAPSDALQGVVAANYSYNDRGLRRMAAIGNNNPYGRGLANVFADEFRALGGTITQVAIFAESKTTYSSDLQTLFTGTLPEAVYLANYPTDGLNIMRDWAANSAWDAVDWIFSEGVLDQAGFVDKLGQQGIPAPTIQNFEGTAPGAYLGVVGALYDRFLENYTARFAGEDPGLFTANAYDAVYIVAAAAQRAGATSGAAIREQMRAVSNPAGSPMIGGQWAQFKDQIRNATADPVDYEGASGSVNLDEFGDPLSGYGVWGINPQGDIFTIKLFNESTVVDMLQAPPPAFAGVAGTELAPVEWATPTRFD